MVTRAKMVTAAWKQVNPKDLIANKNRTVAGEVAKLSLEEWNQILNGYLEKVGFRVHSLVKVVSGLRGVMASKSRTHHGTDEWTFEIRFRLWTEEIPNPHVQVIGGKPGATYREKNTWITMDRPDAVFWQIASTLYGDPIMIY